MKFYCSILSLVFLGTACPALADQAPAPANFPTNFEQIHPSSSQQDSDLIAASTRKNATSDIRKAVRLGAKINATDDEGKTALMLASEAGRLANVYTLLDLSADANLRSDDGETALGSALDALDDASPSKRERYLEIIYNLIYHGKADVTLPYDGEIPIWFLPIDANDLIAVKTLVRAGVDLTKLSIKTREGGGGVLDCAVGLFDENGSEEEKRKAIELIKYLHDDKGLEPGPERRELWKDFCKSHPCAACVAPSELAPPERNAQV